MKALTISSKGQIAIHKEIREVLDIKGGDKLTYELKKGKIVLEPIVSVPRSQAYFWDPEVHEKVKKAEENFKSGNYKTHAIDKFIKELKD